jgi:hypothetical protein
MKHAFFALLLVACSGNSFAVGEAAADGTLEADAGTDSHPQTPELDAGAFDAQPLPQGAGGSSGMGAVEDSGAGGSPASSGGNPASGGARFGSGGSSVAGSTGSGGAGTGGSKNECSSCTPGGFGFDSSPLGCSSPGKCPTCSLATGACGVIYNGACSDNHAGAFFACGF